MPTVPAERVAQVFVEVADTLVDEFDLIEVLQRVTTHTSELGGAVAAGLLLADSQGRLQLMAASDERAKMLEVFQVQAQEGPCQDCFRTGYAVMNADLREAHLSWPLFAPHAVAAGFRSVHAFPLRLRKRVIGALNLFGNDVGGMRADEMRVIQALADIATIGLLQERAIRRGEVLSEQLQSALNRSIVIEQATGVLAELHGCSTDDAFETLRAYCHRHKKRLENIAEAVVADSAGVPGLARR